MILFGSEVTVSVTAPLRSHSLANVSFEGQGSRGLRVFCLTFLGDRNLFSWRAWLHPSVRVYGRMPLVEEVSATGFLTSLVTRLHAGLSRGLC